MQNEFETNQEKILKACSEYEDGVLREFHNLLNEWPSDISGKPVSQVLSGLIARQTKLTLSLVSNYTYWNAHFGPLLLRPILENWLKIAWSRKDPETRAIGVAKGDLIGAENKLHAIKARLDDKEKIEKVENRIQIILDRKKNFPENAKPILIDSRQMANDLEGEPLTMYKKFNVRFTSCVHSAWNHIARHNLIVNSNPLHRYHLLPKWEEDIATDLNFPILAAQFCDGAFKSIGEANSFEKSSYQQLLKKLIDSGIQLKSDIES